jgi:hypothetical protein
VQWERITATDGSILELGGLIEPDEVARVVERLRESATLADAIRARREPLAQRGHA